MRGKEKCKALKEIRRQIAEKNDIEFIVSECKHQGECKGTCPKCEAELQYLERELSRRQSLGKAVCIAGISIAVCSNLTACEPNQESSSVFFEFNGNGFWGRGDAESMEGTAPAPVELDGDVEIQEPEVLTGDIAVYEQEELDGDVEMWEPEALAGDIAIYEPEIPDGDISMPEEDE